MHWESIVLWSLKQVVVMSTINFFTQMPNCQSIDSLAQKLLLITVLLY